MTDTKGRKERIEFVSTLKEKVDASKSIVFTDYKGLTAKQMSELRLKLRDLGAEAGIAKNTLLKIALGKDYDELTGPTMAIFSYKDPISSIKALFDFAGENEDKPVIKAGIVEGNYTNANGLETLSKLPSREQLLAQAIGGLKSPINGFVGVLGGVQRNFVYAIAQISKQKESK